MEVAGLSGSRSSFNTGPFLEWMDRLTAVVEVMTRQMAQITDSTQSVSRSNDHLSASLETFLKECHFFMAPGMRTRSQRIVRQRLTQRRLNRRSRGSMRSRRTLTALCWSKWSDLDSL